MITPSFGLTATERVLPKLALDFTTAILDPRVTFTRSGNTATYTNSSGVLTLATNNQPRFDYDPVTLACKGLLIEESRTNLLLNSLIDGTTLSTQIVTTAATPYTLSFYGTGTITLSGTATDVVSGIGVYPSRKTYTFTPTAGALTCTVTGTVQFAQLEAGAFPTSYIPTTTTALTRNADVATMTGTNFSSWYNASEGAFECEFMPEGLRTSYPIAFNGGTGANFIALNYDVAGTQAGRIDTSGVTQASIQKGTAVVNTISKGMIAYKVDNIGVSFNAIATGTDTSATIPTVSGAVIGSLTANNPSFQFCGWVRKINYYPQRLTNNEVQAFTK